MTSTIDWQRQNGWLRALDTAIEQVQKRSTDLEDDEEGEVLSAGDLLTAEGLADRQRELDLRDVLLQLR